MIPFANATVTLYHKKAEGVERYAVSGCSLSRRSARAEYNGVAQYTEVSTCRIPDTGPKPAPGDVIVPGVVQDVARGQIDLATLLDKYRATGAFLVDSVSENAMPGLPLKHWAARGM